MAKRYFTTNSEGYLYWIWDDQTKEMLYTSDYPTVPLGEWNKYGSSVEDPSEINDSVLGDFQEDNPMYAYETDENWNRLSEASN